MNRVKQFLSLGMIFLLALGLGGCQSKTNDYDVSGYIRSVLDSTYRGESENYITFTGATDQEATLNSSTTTSNAAVRFFTKYGMNASEEQKTALAGVFTKVYKGCTYTVAEKEETDTGYDVTVQFEPMTAYTEIASQIENMKTTAGDSAYDTGAAYIDDVVALCENVGADPSYGDTISKTFDIRLSDNGQLSVNINLFEQMDAEMLPF